MLPWLVWPFGSLAGTQSTEPHQPGLLAPLTRSQPLRSSAAPRIPSASCTAPVPQSPQIGWALLCAVLYWLSPLSLTPYVPLFAQTDPTFFQGIGRTGFLSWPPTMPQLPSSEFRSHWLVTKTCGFQARELDLLISGTLGIPAHGPECEKPLKIDGVYTAGGNTQKADPGWGTRPQTEQEGGDAERNGQRRLSAVPPAVSSEERSRPGAARGSGRAGFGAGSSPCYRSIPPSACGR